MRFKDLEGEFEYLPEALFLEDFDGNILDVNDRACDLLGYEREELLELTVDDLVPEGAPAFLPGQIDEATRSGEPLETLNLDKDGNQIPVELRGKVIEVEGNERMLISVRDISERKTAKKKYELIAEGSSQPIYLFQDGEFKFVNDSFVEMSGYSRDELSEIHFLELVHPDYRQDISEWTRKALNGQTSDRPQKIEYKILTQEGRTIWIRSFPSLIEYRGNPAITSNAIDITESKRVKQELVETKEKLKRSKERYQSYFEELGDAVFVIAMEEEELGKILEVNPTAVEQTGYSREELIGMNLIEDLTLDSSTDLDLEEVNEKLNRGDTVNFVEKKKKKNGDEYWTEVVITPIEHEGKEANLSINRDISGRKEAKKELKRSEAKFKAIAEQVHDGIYIYKRGRFEWVNRRASEILGYSREELTQKSVWDLIHPQDRDRVKKMTRKMMGGKETPSTYEARVLTKDGDVKHAEFAASLIEYKGEQAILGAARDITERKKAERKLKQSEERLELALEGAQAGIWDWNVQTGDVVFSERWAEIVGYTLEELQPVTIETWEELTHPEDLKRSDELLEKHFNGETEVYECEARMKHKNGDWVWILARGRVVEWGEEGEPTRMVGTHQDITDRKRAEQALNEERNKLKNLHDAVEELQRQDNEEEILQIAVNVAEEMLDFQLCAISILEGNYLVPKANSTDLDPEETASFKVGEGIAGKTVQRGETIWGEDLRNYREAQPTQDGFRAFISVPIGNIGTIQVISKEVGSFDERDVELTEILAGHLRQELKRVRLEEQLREKADSIKSTSEKLESLHNVARKLESAKDEQEVFELGVEAAVENLQFLVCSFSVAKGDHFEVMATSEEPPEEWTHEDMPVDEGLTGKTYRTKETYAFGDLREVEEAKPARPEYRSVISLPVGDIGVFQVLSERTDAFSEEDVRLAELLCGHVYEATQRVRLENELKEEAIHDPLTGLYNRRYFNETLGEEVERCKRYDKSIAFLMMDINSFKEVNDRYSHQTGDEVLKEVANLLKQNVRDADTVVRYGGDEFLVMMPETNGGVSEIINRLKEELSRWNKQASLIDFPLTLAMGVSHWYPDQDRDVEEALKEADEKMYEDKGR